MVKGKLMVRMFPLFHNPQIVATIEKGRFKPAFLKQRSSNLPGRNRMLATIIVEAAARLAT